MDTLRALETCKRELGVRTILGVSNISFGLPCREYLNVSFLTLAMARGLDLAILNPNAEPMMAAVASYRVLSASMRAALPILPATPMPPRPLPPHSRARSAWNRRWNRA